MLSKTLKTQEHLNSGINFHRSGKLKEATLIYKQVLARDKNNCDALNLLGVITLQSGMPEKAVRLLKKAVNRNPNNSGFLNNLGQAQHALGKVTKAISCYEQALKIFPTNIDALNNMGISLSFVGRYKEARAVYENALSLNNEDPELLHNYAILLQELKHLPAAIKNYQKAISINSKLFAVHASLASALEESGQRDQAINSYLDAIKINPLYLEAHAALKKIRWASKDIVNLHASYKLVSETYPNSVEGLCNFANSLCESGDINEAQTIIEKAISQSKSNGRSFNILATVFKAQKQYNKALEAHRKSIDLERNNFIFRENLGHTLSLAGRFEEAIVELLAAYKLNPRRSAILGSLTISMNETEDRRLKHYVNYDKFVTTQTIDTPNGFSNLQEFNDALHQEISDRHNDSPPPLDQTMRGGTQIPNHLFKAPSRLTHTIKIQIKQTLKEYIGSLKLDLKHPFLRFKNREFRFSGAWSTILYGSGYDGSHIHNDGWLSGVYYIKVPDFPDEVWASGEGCLQIGEPPSQFVSPKNQAQKILKPIAGSLTLFPSYYWHGVKPFKRDGIRHAIAFDII